VKIRILIADDHSIVRDGLKRILAATPDLQVAGEAASGEAALALVKAHDYDIAMLDMSMPGLSGIDLIKRLKLEKPKLRILVLSMHGEKLVEGLGPTEIGERLHLSVKTVSTHKTHIFDKLNVESTAELVRYALEHRLF